MTTFSPSPRLPVSLSPGLGLARPWFISRAGFTPEAEEFARREGIMISGKADIERLAEIVRRA